MGQQRKYVFKGVGFKQWVWGAIVRSHETSFVKRRRENTPGTLGIEVTWEEPSYRGLEGEGWDPERNVPCSPPQEIAR